MAKDKRFPSDANRPKPTVVKPSTQVKSGPNMDGGAVPKESKVLEPAPVVGVKQDLVQVEYKGENHVVLHGSVHQIRKGVNHLPRDVWEKHKSHPHLAQLLKDGSLVGPTEDEESEPKEAEDEPKFTGDGQDKSESDDESDGKPAA